MTNQKGGSQASNRVMALLPEQCNVKQLGPISPLQSDNLEGMNFYQTTGGGYKKCSLCGKKLRTNKRSNRKRSNRKRSNRKSSNRKRSNRKRANRKQ